MLGSGGVAQVAECLLCKCETLSSNSSPTKKKIAIVIKTLGTWNKERLLKAIREKLKGTD
jgi:hypothetical protein